MTTTIVDMDLPAHTHAAVCTNRSPVSGEDVSAVVVWADRPLVLCPGCEEVVVAEVDECPVMMDTGWDTCGQLTPFGAQHGCGYDVGAQWSDVPPSRNDELGEEDAVIAGVSRDAVGAVAQDLADARREAIEDEKRRVTARLRRDLAEFFAEMCKPLDRADAETWGDRLERLCVSEVAAGVSWTGREFLAWDQILTGEDEAEEVVVRPEDLITWAQERACSSM